MKQNPRWIAVQALGRLSKPGNRLDRLSSERPFLRLDSRDRRLVMELAYGTVRWRGRLDYSIGQIAKRGLSRIDSVVLWILRVALYQISFLRSPARAVVHEAVESCRLAGKEWATGFVNAVLRRYLREAPALPTGSGVRALSIRHSHPEWLIERYLLRHGIARAEKLLAANNLPPPGYLWVNPFKTSVEELMARLRNDGLERRPYPVLPNCLIAPTSLAGHPLYRDGFCFFMDAASQAVAGLAPLTGRRLLGDYCSAPGGKSFLLAAAKDKEALLVCTDRAPGRLREMRERARLYQVPGLNFAVCDWRQGGVVGRRMDFVLLDVPCSGLGTLRPNPDIRWRLSEQDLAAHQERQLELLHNGFQTLAPGGVLLYSTCSTEPEENEQVVEAFLAREKGAEVAEKAQRSLPFDAGDVAAAKPDQPGRGLEDIRDGDAFFAVKIRHSPSSYAKFRD